MAIPTARQGIAQQYPERVSRAVDQYGQLIDLRLTTRRDMNAASAFFRQARETIRIYAPVTVTTDKAPTYPRIISEMNGFCFPGDEIKHTDTKGRNNLIESDHASLKRLIGPGRGFQSLRTAKATLKGVEVHCTIKKGHYHGSRKRISGEIDFSNGLFGIAA